MTDRAWSWPGDGSSSGRGSGRIRTPFTAIPNVIQDALMSSAFTSREFRVLHAVSRLTYGWRKEQDFLSYQEVADRTGLPRRHVADTMRALKRAGVLIRLEANGRGEKLAWGINPDPGTWDLAALKRIRAARRFPKGSQYDGREIGDQAPNRCYPPALNWCRVPSTNLVLLQRKI